MPFRLGGTRKSEPNTGAQLRPSAPLPCEAVNFSSSFGRAFTHVLSGKSRDALNTVTI